MGKKLPTKRSSQKNTNPPPRRPNAESRLREYLTPVEVKAMINAARNIGRHGERDALIILMLYRHALRVGELVKLQWEQFDWERGLLKINRLKNSATSVHYLEADEKRALKKLRPNPQIPTNNLHNNYKFQKDSYVFLSERQGPLSINAVHKIVARAGEVAELEISAHPHMLRHGKGFELAAKGVDTRVIQAYFGHKSIQHSAAYSEVHSGPLKGLGKDLG